MIANERIQAFEQKLAFPLQLGEVVFAMVNLKPFQYFKDFSEEIGGALNKLIFDME